MTIWSERWLGLGLSLEVRSESNHAFSGIHLFVSSMTDASQRAGLCRGNFFISKFLAGSFRHLKRFWARLSVCVAERACRLFSVVAAWRPSKRAKPASWDRRSASLGTHPLLPEWQAVSGGQVGSKRLSRLVVVLSGWKCLMVSKNRVNSSVRRRISLDKSRKNALTG